MKKIILSGSILVAIDELESIRKSLPLHIAQTRSEPGCIVFEVEESRKELGRFEVYEEFDSKAAFERHHRRVRDSQWGVVSKNVIRNYAIKEIEV